VGVRLTEADEGVHTVGPEPNWNESRYVDFWDAGSRVGGWFRIGNRPNERYAEMSACVYLPDRRVAFNFERATIEANGLAAGGQTWMLDDPFHTNRVRYEGEMIDEATRKMAESVARRGRWLGLSTTSGRGD